MCICKVVLQNTHLLSLDSDISKQFFFISQRYYFYLEGKLQYGLIRVDINIKCSV